MTVQIIYTLFSDFFELPKETQNPIKIEILFSPNISSISMQKSHLIAV